MNYTEMPDIYFNENYPKLYESIEQGKACAVCVNNEHGSIVSHVILRKIPFETDIPYFDIVTPYGYGGPIITSLKGDKEKLVQSFHETMKTFTQEHNIVSEFVRFHPILENGIDFKSIYNSEKDRKTVGTNLRDYEIEEEFCKSARKYIRRAEKAGVSYEVIYKPKDISEFKQIYYSTMDRDNADEYYYFDDEYFTQCLETLGEYILYVKVLLGEKVIAAGLYFACGDIVQCHLSGTLTDYLYLSPAYITKLATAKWAKENGKSFIHYGGGTSRDEENSLYQFKKKFGKHTDFDFYVGRKIWNETAYSELCSLAQVDPDSKFFPAYRSK